MDFHMQRPFRLAAGQTPDSDIYVPQYRLIAAFLIVAAEVVLAARPGPINTDTLIRSMDLRVDNDAEAEHLLEVLEQAGVVSPPDFTGRRDLLTGASKRHIRTAMTKVKAIAHVASQLGDVPIGCDDEGDD